jgi:hypothetical protein
LFLHHSTGKNIWLGGTNKYINRLTNRSAVQDFFSDYNRKHGTSIEITEQAFPKESPYGWKNYPFDYYNIWVKNAGVQPYMEEPTLEILTRDYDVIIFKHCYPVSKILPDTGYPDIDSEEKRLENYKLQYNALKSKLHEFPDNKFIIWTPAVMVESRLSEDEAIRTKMFHEWIMNEWDEKGDNIFIWDFYSYETEGGLYLAASNAESPENSHPNRQFSEKMAPLFSEFVINVIDGKID